VAHDRSHSEIKKRSQPVAVNATTRNVFIKSMTQITPDPTDPALPSALLTQLSKSQCQETCRAVAKNPNTPLEDLHHLWLSYPECVLENPILVMWEFTSPKEVPELISPSVLLALFNSLRAKEEPLPENIFNERGLGCMVSEELTKNNAAVFQQFPIDPDVEIRKAFIQAVQPHPRSAFFFDTAPDHVWLALANDPCEEVAVKFSELLGKFESEKEPLRSVFTEATLTLARRKNSKIHLQLSRCRLLPSETIDVLLEIGDVRTRSQLAATKFASTESRIKLARDGNKAVRLAMAKAATQDVVLRAFPMNDDAAVLKAVLTNRATPNDLRCQIVREASAAVQEILCDEVAFLAPPFYFECKSHLTAETRGGICKRQGLHRDILLDLTQDQDDSVRVAVAKNLEAKYRSHPSRLIEEVLTRFASDSSEEVRMTILSHIALSHDQARTLLADPLPSLRASMADHLLKKLKSLREKKTLNKYQDLYLAFAPSLIDMARDPDESVRLVLAQGEETPPNALKLLCEDASENVNRSAYYGTVLPLGFFIDAGIPLATIKRPTRIFVKTLAQSDNPFLRHLAAKSPHACQTDLERLANDLDRTVANAATHKLAMRAFYKAHRVARDDANTGPQLAIA
jgi:hypothetical protein